MRLALVVVPFIAKASATARRVSLLADRLVERLAEPDAGYRVEVVEARGRLGERVASLLRERGNTGPTLVFVSSEISLSDDGPAIELTGGNRLALAELRSTLAAEADETLLVLDAKHAADPDDPTLSATLIDAIRAAVEPRESGIGLLIGARPEEDEAGATSAFARAFLAALDQARGRLSRVGRVTADALYEDMRADEERFHEITAAGWFAGRGEFPVLVQQSVVVGGLESGPPSRQSARPTARQSVRPSIPPGARTPAVEEAWKSGAKSASEGHHAEAIDHYKRALLLLGHAPERAELYFRIGKAKEALGKAAEAIHNYDKALGIEPLHHDAFARASGLLETQRDFARLERLLRRRLDARSDVEAKVKELSAIAELWEAKAKEPAKAIPALESWAKLAEDTTGLGRLVDALSHAGRHAGANAVRLRLAAHWLDDAPKRAKVLLAAAQAAAAHLPGGGDALELARATLDADPGLFEALEIAALALGSRRRWRELAELYERLIERIKDDRVGWDLGKKLGMLYRDELDDVTGAISAFERAASRNRADVELSFWLSELYEATGDVASAATVFRATAAAASEDVAVFRRALWCFEKTGEADSAWNAACVIDQLGDADINESLLADTHRPEGLIAARGVVGDDEWERLMPSRDEPLERLLSLVQPAARQLRFSSLERDRLTPKVSESTLQNPNGTTTLARSLAWTARLLGQEVPAVHVLPEVPGELSPLPLLEPTAAASRGVASGLELPELAFLWARVLVYLRPEHSIVVFYPTARDVATLLLGSLAVTGVEEAEGDAAVVADGLAEILDDEELEALSEAANALEKRRLRTRVARYVNGVHAAASRAGLVACGDIARAIELTGRYPLPGGPSKEQQVAELRAFSISAEYALIRQHLGIAVKV
ncbi:MAG: tetratricopeptide repeat protein [Myxococcales bacterium]|nr:tetratricopeptide repeat protein [Myxococcales bacterium]